MTRHLRSVLLSAVLCLFLASCTTVKPAAVRSPSATAARSTAWHTVAPGETLWRISKIYDVPLAAIMSANTLTDETDIKMGQHLRIPGAREAHQPLTLPDSDKWKYIIVHHTATEAGSSIDFHKSHLDRGWDRGIGYHFVINNSRGEKPDGFIEVTPRWLKQQDGAHCKAADMNINGIGVSLVGNFNEDRVTPAQWGSLIELVDKLKKKYKIPKRNILGHKMVKGSNTQCPGSNFPWDTFMRRLR